MALVGARWGMLVCIASGCFYCRDSIGMITRRRQVMQRMKYRERDWVCCGKGGFQIVSVRRGRAAAAAAAIVDGMVR